MCRFVSKVFTVLADTANLTNLMLVAKGWTIVRRKLSAHGQVAWRVAGTANRAPASGAVGRGGFRSLSLFLVWFGWSGHELFYWSHAM